MDYRNTPSKQGNYSSRIEELEEKVSKMETKIQNLELELKRVRK